MCDTTTSETIEKDFGTYCPNFVFPRVLLSASEARWSQLKNLVLPMPPDCDTRCGEDRSSIKSRNVFGQMLNSSPKHDTANMKLLVLTVVRDYSFISLTSLSAIEIDLLYLKFTVHFFSISRLRLTRVIYINYISNNSKLRKVADIILHLFINGTS